MQTEDLIVKQRHGISRPPNSQSHRSDSVVFRGFNSIICGYQGNGDEDGFITALDLANIIDVLFAGAPDVQDPLCPDPRFDLDCDGFTTALDLAVIIDHLFAGGNGPCNPCSE